MEHNVASKILHEYLVNCINCTQFLESLLNYEWVVDILNIALAQFCLSIYGSSTPPPVLLI